jgi:hypothetical protein
VVVNDLYIIRISAAPCEADTELVVDANAVLAGTISRERLKAITWRAS